MFFTPAEAPQRGDAGEQRGRLEAEAQTIASEHHMRHRTSSSDVNVLVEIFRDRVYAGPTADLRALFDPAGHVVLDVGAHIGAFSVWCAERGASHVAAYEPEPTNVSLLRENVARFGDLVEVHEAAVQQPVGGGLQHESSLVLGRSHQGVQNTWRHALCGLSHYSEGGGKLARIPVCCVPFWDNDGAALTKQVTFVKLDCEGAELQILRFCATGNAFRNVKCLIFEYSFTKERKMSTFFDIVDGLRSVGFQVFYAGAGAWETLSEWPWYTDALVYCAKVNQD